MAALSNRAQIEVTSRAELRRWLTLNHTQAEGIWLVTYKKPDPRNLPYDDVVEEALCFGWIDSLPRKLDESRSMLLLAPRKAASAWSALNKKRVAKLIAEDKMQPAGLRTVAAAKAGGHWTRLDAVEALEIPPDLAAAFSKAKSALQNFEAFPRSVKRAILEWIMQAKKPETRAARISETVSKAKDNIRANQWRQ
jgi:uncharacterized protein YdeI (YjbR/CyaY-like superfamily)